jgi:hypothetical protein
MNGRKCRFLLTGMELRVRCIINMKYITSPEADAVTRPREAGAWAGARSTAFRQQPHHLGAGKRTPPAAACPDPGRPASTPATPFAVCRGLQRCSVADGASLSPTPRRASPGQRQEPGRSAKTGIRSNFGQFWSLFVPIDARAGPISAKRSGFGPILDRFPSLAPRCGPEVLSSELLTRTVLAKP